MELVGLDHRDEEPLRGALGPPGRQRPTRREGRPTGRRERQTRREGGRHLPRRAEGPIGLMAVGDVRARMAGAEVQAYEPRGEPREVEAVKVDAGVLARPVEGGHRPGAGQIHRGRHGGSFLRHRRTWCGIREAAAGIGERDADRGAAVGFDEPRAYRGAESASSSSRGGMGIVAIRACLGPCR